MGDQAADQRDEAADQRDEAADLRDEAAGLRDTEVRRRDDVAAARDRAAQDRDEAAEERDHAARDEDRSAAPVAAEEDVSSRADAETASRAAASDRRHSRQDRLQAAAERTAAGSARDSSAGDRAASAGDRRDAAWDREQAAVDRRVAARQITTAGREERERLAEHLHHEVVQLLAAAVLRLDLVDRSDERIDQVHRPLAEATRLLRGTISDLELPGPRPGALRSAIADHATRLLGSDGITVEIASDLGAADLIAAEVLDAAYRIVQEALSNVSRHAQATKVRVEVSVEAGRLRGTIADDGVGLDQDRLGVALARPGHLGLRLMRERAIAAGGAVEFRQPGSGSGTEVRWWLPLSDDDDLTGPCS